jgi:hypothetical protein
MVKERVSSLSCRQEYYYYYLLVHYVLEIFVPRRGGPIGIGKQVGGRRDP